MVNSWSRSTRIRKRGGRVGKEWANWGCPIENGLGALRMRFWRHFGDTPIKYTTYTPSPSQTMISSAGSPTEAVPTNLPELSTLISPLPPLWIPCAPKPLSTRSSVLRTFVEAGSALVWARSLGDGRACYSSVGISFGAGWVGGRGKGEDVSLLYLLFFSPRCNQMLIK
jgi:hypothetical protein